MLNKLRGQLICPSEWGFTWSICAALTAPTTEGEEVYSEAVNPRLRWLRIGTSRSSSSSRGNALAVCYSIRSVDGKSNLKRQFQVGREFSDDQALLLGYRQVCFPMFQEHSSFLNKIRYSLEIDLVRVSIRCNNIRETCLEERFIVDVLLTWSS